MENKTKQLKVYYVAIIREFESKHPTPILAV